MENPKFLYARTFSFTPQILHPTRSYQKTLSATTNLDRSNKIATAVLIGSFYCVQAFNHPGTSKTFAIRFSKQAVSAQRSYWPLAVGAKNLLNPRTTDFLLNPRKTSFWSTARRLRHILSRKFSVPYGTYRKFFRQLLSRRRPIWDGDYAKHTVWDSFGAWQYGILPRPKILGI